MSDPDNVELAEQGLIPLDDEPRGPRLQDWDPVVAALTEIKDLIHLQINATLIAGGIKKVPRFTPSARPTTLVSEAMRAVEDATSENDFWDLVAQVTPDYARAPAPPERPD